MDNKIIGLLGGEGKIGSQVVQLLSKYNKKYLIGTRRKIDCKEKYYVDVNIKKTLIEFLKRVDILINCIGPSMITSEIVLNAALDLGVDYIDPFGWQERFKIKKELNSNVILNAGCVPGLLGILLKKYSKHKPENLIVWSGGREYGTISSITDILLSSIYGYGKANKIIKYGHLQSINSNDKFLYRNKSKFLDYHKINVSSNIYMTEEIEEVARIYGLNNVISYSVWPDETIKNTLLNGCIKLKLNDDNNENQKEIIDNTCNQLLSLNNNKKPWYFIEICVINNNLSNNLIIDVNDSSILSAIILYHMLEQLSNKYIKPNIYSPHQIANIDRVFELMNFRNVNIKLYGEI